MISPACARRSRTLPARELPDSRGVYRLLLAAAKTWRKLDGHDLLPLVRAGVKFVDDVRVEQEVSAYDHATRSTVANSRQQSPTERGTTERSRRSLLDRIPIRNS